MEKTECLKDYQTRIYRIQWLKKVCLNKDIQDETERFEEKEKKQKNKTKPGRFGVRIFRTR